MAEAGTNPSPLARISVAIPNYNHGKCLGTALDSACAQDPPPHEVVVFDDCSTDNSLEVIDSFARRFAFVRLVRYPEKSADWARALLTHTHLLSGDYVLVLGADDYIYPGFMRAFGQMIVQYPQCGMFFSDFHCVDLDRRIIREVRSGFDAPRFVHGREMADRMCRIDGFESGVGSVARKDLLLWIDRNMPVILGPWYEMAYPVMAMKNGACYIPSFLAAYTDVPLPDSAKWRLELCSDSHRSMKFFQNLKDFLRSPEISSVLSPEVIEVLETRAMFDFKFQGRGAILWRRLMDRAQALIASGRFEQAEQWLGRVVQIFPRHAEAFFAWGVVLHKLGRLADEEQAFRRAAELNPSMAAAHSNWGTCRQAQGFEAEAIAAYRRSIEADPGFAAGYVNLGRLLSAQGRWQEALAVQQRRVELSPREADGFVQMTNTLLALGRAEEALAASRTAIALDPGSGEARTALENAMRRLERLST